MSQYTTELRYLIQQNFDIGLKDYPIFDEGYRNVLNRKIINEYFFREIGQETPARFSHYMNHTMNMIMPYYNQLYESELLKINPLITFSETEELKRSTDVNANDTTMENQSGTSTNESSGRESGFAISGTEGKETTAEETANTRTEDKLNVSSDTPGGMLSIGDIKSHTWASNADMGEGTISDNGTNDRTVSRDDETITDTERTNTGKATANMESSGTTSRSGIVETVDEYLKTKTGFTGNQARLLEAYRKTFLNIDQQIVRELNSLFMGVF